MKIAINTRLLQKNKLEGIGWFTYETLKRIAERNPQHQFFFIFDRPYDKSFVFAKNTFPITAGIPARHPILWWLWFEFTLPKVFKQLDIDFFISPDGFLSLKSNVNQLAVIHDLGFESRPQDLPLLSRWYYRHFFPKYARKAIRIATVSEFSKQDIVSKYQISPDLIDVVYNGVNEIFKPISLVHRNQTKEKYTQGTDFFIYIGSLHPRKNIEKLLLAFEQFQKNANKSYKLVIVGEAMFKTRSIRQIYSQMQFKSDIVFTGRISTEELRFVLGSAVAFVNVSYFEGFGIPLLEAMQCEVPIICSNTSALPEIAEKAALYVDPNSVTEISSALQELSSNKTLRRKLIAEAREVRMVYSWRRTSLMLWDSFLFAVSMVDNE